MKKILVSILLIVATMSHAESKWPYQTGAKIKNNALEYPTTLKATDKSLSTYLN